MFSSDSAKIKPPKPHRPECRGRTTTRLASLKNFNLSGHMGQICISAKTRLDQCHHYKFISIYKYLHKHLSSSTSLYSLSTVFFPKFAFFRRPRYDRHDHIAGPRHLHDQGSDNVVCLRGTCRDPKAILISLPQ